MRSRTTFRSGGSVALTISHFQNYYPGSLSIRYISRASENFSFRVLTGVRGVWSRVFSSVASFSWTLGASTSLSPTSKIHFSRALRTCCCCYPLLAQGCTKSTSIAVKLNRRHFILFLLLFSFSLSAPALTIHHSW